VESEDSEDSRERRILPSPKHLSKLPMLLFIIALVASSIWLPLHLPLAHADTTFLSDHFTQDTNLNTNLWQVNGPVGKLVGQNLPSFLSDSIVTPNLTFSASNGMGFSGVNSTYEAASIQSIQSFTPPFTAQASVMATVADGNPFDFLISTSSGSALGMDGNPNPANDGYYGIWESIAPGGGLSTQLLSTPSLNTIYNLTITVNATGNAKLLVSSQGQILGQLTAQVSVGPFFVLLVQWEAQPITVGPNQAYWQSVSVSTPAPSQDSVNLSSPCVNGLQVDINGGALPGSAVTFIGWNWGDGQGSTGFFPESHVYAAAGAYDVTVTAHYNDGSSASTSVSVNVGQSILQNCVSLTMSSGQGGSISYVASVGSGIVSSGASKTLYLDFADDLNLAASPNSGFSFNSWIVSPGITGLNGAPVSSSSPSITIVVDGTGSVTAHFTPTPSFQLEASPDSQVILIGETQSASFLIRILPQNGFSSNVVVILTGLPQGVSCEQLTSGTCGSDLTLPDYSVTLVLDASDQTVPRTYPLTLVATSPNSPSPSRSLGLTLIITEIVGVKNVVTLTDYTISKSSVPDCNEAHGALKDQCFSVQQNFFVNMPGRSGPLFWIQNGLEIVRATSGVTRSRPIMDIWNNVVVGNNCFPSSTLLNQTVGSNYSDTPETITVESVISGNFIRLDTLGNEFTYPLPPSAYISEIDSRCQRLEPQLDIVGFGGGAQASFTSQTKGNVESYVQLAGSTLWKDSITQTMLACTSVFGDPLCVDSTGGSSTGTSTGETALNLVWTAKGTNLASFSYQSGDTYQGVAYLPLVSHEIGAVTTSTILGGNAIVDHTSTTGVGVNITGSSAGDGTSIAVSSVYEANSQPSGTGGLTIGSVAFFDVKVTGISDGTATICFTSPLVPFLLLLPGPVMEYWDGFVWVKAANIQVSTSMICGTVPVSALSGTPIVVGNPPRVSVSEFFTNGSASPLSLDSKGNPSLNVILSNGRVRSTNPGQVLAWISIANTGNAPLQSLKLNETLPLDWALHPSWSFAKGAISVYFKLSNGTLLNITSWTSISSTTGNPETISLSILNMTATLAGQSLKPGESILLSAKLSYDLMSTSQAFTSYPRNYTDMANALAWMQASFGGGQASDSGSAFFTAYAKSAL
jgi:hypothetical protein